MRALNRKLLRDLRHHGGQILAIAMVVACGVEGPGTASEVALALKLARPTVLLAPSPEAAAFFRSLDAASLHEVETPEAAVELIQHRLGIARWSIPQTRMEGGA